MLSYQRYTVITQGFLGHANFGAVGNRLTGGPSRWLYLNFDSSFLLISCFSAVLIFWQCRQPSSKLLFRRFSYWYYVTTGVN